MYGKEILLSNKRSNFIFIGNLTNSMSLMVFCPHFTMSLAFSIHIVK